MLEMRSFAVLFAPIALALSSCGTTEELRGSRAEREAEALRPYHVLENQKAALWEIGQEPQVFEFEGQGRVHVSDWKLSGWPGSVYVTARLRYENTTDRPMRGAVVWLEVLDSTETVRGSTGVRMFNPLGYSVWPGGSITREIRAPTNDAHLDGEGWQWGIHCDAEVDQIPGPKPAFVVNRDRNPDGTVPDPRFDRPVRKPSVYSIPSARRSAPPVREPIRPGVNFWEQGRR